jgi:hypothetical protein
LPGVPIGRRADNLAQDTGDPFIRNTTESAL